jgi:hypothetical protein
MPRRPVATLPLLIAALLVAAACGSTAATATPEPSRGPVTTPRQAWAAVVAFEPRFGSITARDPNLIGQSAWFDVQAASGVGAFVAMVQIGWGDCPAGCIDRHDWTLAIAPDGTVTVVADEGPVVPVEQLPDSGIGTGLTIRATAGPICPVESVPPDPSCAHRPVVGARIVIKDGSGATVADGSTGLLGTLDVALPRGDYLVEAAPVEGYMGTPAPTSASVGGEIPVAVDLGYDTGIR